MVEATERGEGKAQNVDESDGRKDRGPKRRRTTRLPFVSRPNMWSLVSGGRLKENPREFSGK